VTPTRKPWPQPVVYAFMYALNYAAGNGAAALLYRDALVALECGRRIRQWSGGES
jgi:hypothetical protein